MTADPGRPATPTNPRWVKITVIALMGLVWLAAVIAIVRGESWVEAGFTALILRGLAKKRDERFAGVTASALEG